MADEIEIYAQEETVAVQSENGYPVYNETISWNEVTGKPSTYPPSSHTHKWSEITGKPSTFAPSSHTHQQSEVTGLSAALSQRDRVWNLLDNSNFMNPVNQRGNTTYNGTAYGIDRWYGRVNNQTTTVRSADVTITATSTQYAGLRQKINNIAALAGKKVTFACNLYSSVTPYLRFVNASASTLASVTGTKQTTGTLILTFAIPADATADTVIPEIVIASEASGDYARLYWAALYEGEYTAETLPSYVPKGYATELAECQRYYQTIYKVFGTSVGNVSREAIVLRPRMRIAPTVTQLSIWQGSTGAGYTVQGAGQTYVDIQYTGWGNVSLALSADL